MNATRILIAIAATVTLGWAGPAPQAPPQAPPDSEQRRPPDDSTDDATVHHPFDDIEMWARAFDDPSRAEWQKPEEVVKALGLSPGMNVADIGAGTGYFNRLFAGAVAPGGKVYPADIEPKMVEHMKERAVKEKTPNVAPILAAPDDPRLPEGAIDLILICNTYHHIDNRLKYFDRLRKTLRPGGRIAIIDYQKRDLPIGPSAEHKLSREQIVAEMEAAGYHLVSEPAFLPYQYFLIFALK